MYYKIQTGFLLQLLTFEKKKTKRLQLMQYSGRCNISEPGQNHIIVCCRHQQHHRQRFSRRRCRCCSLLQMYQNINVPSCNNTFFS